MRLAFTLIMLTLMPVCSGCITGGTPVAMKPAPIEIIAAVPPVTPESVTEDNYRACANRLRDELDRAEQRIQLSKSTD